jgi:predicted phosphodiesterase
MGVESKMSKFILHDHNDDGINRRGFLECMAWAETGVVWTIGGGVLSSRAFGKPAPAGEAKGDMTFVQISDSHIGFNKPANPDVVGTLQAAVDKINALPRAPEFIIHTGDLSHTSKAAEFDTMDQVLKSSKTNQVFYVPGKHDTSVDDGKKALAYMKRFGSVTVLNGHIHQVLQKVEGNVTFHTAMSTAFPQPAPGTAPAAGPMKVPAERLRSVLGITDVQYVARKHSPAVINSPLAAGN